MPRESRATSNTEASIGMGDEDSGPAIGQAVAAWIKLNLL
jgi:hypothetical protein